MACVTSWFSALAGDRPEGCFSDLPFLGGLWKSPWCLQAVYSTSSFCISNLWMLVESRRIELPVLCGVLSLGQHADAGEERCVLKNQECRGSQGAVYLCKGMCSLKSICWYRAV